MGFVDGRYTSCDGLHVNLSAMFLAMFVMVIRCSPLLIWLRLAGCGGSCREMGVW